MRELIVTENVTLDGVIEATEGWFEPAGDEEVDQSDLLASLEEQRNAADAVLFGRVTFEDMRGFWPLQTADETGVTDYLNSVHKYVVSRTLEDPEWENSTVLGGALVDDVRALKSGSGQDIVSTGSISVVHALIDAGLVDEYRLFLYPVVLGRGKRLFADATKVPALTLVESQSFNSGVVLLRYRTHGG